MTDSFNPEVDGFTQGALTLFGICPMKGHLKVNRKLKVPGTESVALRFGSFFHDALDKVYSTYGSEGYEDVELDALVDAVVDMLYDKMKVTQQEKLTEDFPMEALILMAGQVRTLLHCYFQRWSEDFTKYQWYELEGRFDIPFEIDGRQVRLRGKRDGVRAVQGASKKIWLFETKTKSSITDPSIMDFILYNTQVMLYLYSLQVDFPDHEVVGVDYNLVLRPQIRQKKTETLQQYLKRLHTECLTNEDKYFIRYPASVLPEDLEHWVNNDLKAMVRNALDICDGKVSPFRNSAACYQYMRPCEYMRYCAYGDEDVFTVRDVVYPELADDFEPAEEED